MEIFYYNAELDFYANYIYKNLIPGDLISSCTEI